MRDKRKMSCKYNNCKHCGYKSECEIFKENAELKKKNLDTQDAVTMQMYTNKANKEIADRQLTKAKELIKKLLNAFASNDFFEEEELDAMAEAEQFIKDSEVKK